MVVPAHVWAAMMDRGPLIYEEMFRALVNQEVAILAYRQFFESRNVPVLAFKEDGVKLEGAMTSLIVNPRPLGDVAEVKGAVSAWLADQEFTPVSDETFLIKWNTLTESARKVLASLIEEGGVNVKQPLHGNQG